MNAEQSVEAVLIVAIAVDGVDNLPDDHFGAAPRFDLYRLSEDTADRFASIPNPRAGHDHRHPHGHANGDGGEHHGAGVGRLLDERGVQVMVSRAFGQNIVRVRQRFLPVKVSVKKVDQALALLQANWGRVSQSWRDGEQRRHLVLR